MSKCDRCRYRKHWRDDSCWQCKECSRALARGYNYRPRTILQKIIDLIKGYDELYYK